ncbi:uncharacterized protein STEHIDRAFT_150328 [Stereum hirsutum FP-91666 SS1]|uniref:uncharacterized protein n=1 Tax=Stereum hirsutum (strain FP-91666) TaxID=721885 RepID=UPI0004449BC4|nr:uncharacterized protein STEHIDRAFT_150328 [Stereum hirsutum FP-91666 SS1]EIM80589.1 hypothetical protein STEHIDRAFT_150328 [Stereum hirsutum FP-91666 SS1]
MLSPYLPALSMSALIAPDAPLASPLSDSSWEHTQPLHSPTQSIDSFALQYPHYAHNNNNNQYPQPGPAMSQSDSIHLSNPMFRMRMSPEYGSDVDQQLCLPTHQLFDLPPTPPSPSGSSGGAASVSSSSPPSDHSRLPFGAGAPAVKRRSSPGPPVSKKPRASGERITTKDFVPPDVSGLSKREARLVKNRAAAFLSRQRKREEFETMEVRVAELEQENARLLAMTSGGSSTASTALHSQVQSRPPQPPAELLSEIDQLRAQLAAAEQRERELSSRLSRHSPSTIKMEAPEPQLPSPPTMAASRPSSLQQITHKGEKTGASLSLLVLLCALPSIFSVTAQSGPMPMSGTFPLSGIPSNPFASSSNNVDFGSFLPNEYDWRSPNAMDLDFDFHRQRQHVPGRSPAKKLEFVDTGAEKLGLGNLDITFDAEPSQDGKIRVRIHPSGSSGSSPSASLSSASLSSFDDAMPQSLWDSQPPQSYLGGFDTSSLSSLDSSDPFLGIGGMTSLSEFGFDPAMLAGGMSQTQIPTSTGAKRVRIALKSMPTVGGGAGEWEVELC